MLVERNSQEVQQKIMLFLRSGPDQGVVVHRLNDAKIEQGVIENEFVLAFFAADPDLHTIELGVYKGKDVTNTNDYYRRLFEMEFNARPVEGLRESTTDDLFQGVQRSIETGLPLFTLSFGYYKDSKKPWVCIHTMEEIPPKFVFTTVQTYAETQLFGKRLEFKGSKGK